jgi:hypothetical protein
MESGEAGRSKEIPPCVWFDGDELTHMLRLQQVSQVLIVEALTIF